jgi:hypothetical protein
LTLIVDTGALASSTASASDSTACEAILGRVASAATERGYSVSSGPGVVEGVLGRTVMTAECVGAQGNIEIQAERGNSMSVAFAVDGQGFSTEIYASIPGLAGLTRTMVLDDGSTTPLTGFVSFEGARAPSGRTSSTRLMGSRRRVAGTQPE